MRPPIILYLKMTFSKEKPGTKSLLGLRTTYDCAQELSQDRTGRMDEANRCLQMSASAPHLVVELQSKITEMIPL